MDQVYGKKIFKILDSFHGFPTRHILPQLELWLLNVLLFRPGGLLNSSFRPLKGCYQLIFSKNEYELPSSNVPIPLFSHFHVLFSGICFN